MIITPMTNFVKIQVEICLPIIPKLLNEPIICISNQVAYRLLRYSPTLNGVPLSFTIDGVTPHGQIEDDGSIYVSVLVSFCILRLVVGESIEVCEGMHMATFPCRVDDSNSYTGMMEIQSIQQPSMICGTESFNAFI